MKVFGFLLLSALSYLAHGQEKEIQNQMKRYDSLMQHSQNGEKLVWMDSLTSVVEFDQNYRYDSLAKATIDYAIALDSVELAADNISDLIYYYKSYLGNPSESIRVFNQYSPIQDKLDPRDFARMLLNAGNAYQDLGELENAIAIYQKAQQLAKNIDYQRYIGLSEMYIGQSLSMKGEFAEASRVLRNAEPYFAKEKDTFNVINCKIALSILYSQNGFYDEAQAIRAEAIELSERSHELENLIALNYNAATDYRKTHQYQKRVASLLKAYAANQQSEFKALTEIVVLSALVRAYIDVGKMQEATTYLQLMEANPEHRTDERKKTSYLLALKHYYFAQGAYKKALQAGIENLEQRKANQEYEELLDAEKFLSEVYEKLGDSKNALAHLKTFNILNDSINSAQKVKGLSYYQTLYETEKRDLKIKTQESDLALLEQQNKVKNQWIVFGSLGLLCLFGFVLLIRSRNQYRNQKLQQELFSKALMEAQENERTRVAKDLHDSVGQQLTLIQKKASNAQQDELALMTSKALEEVRAISKALYPPILKNLGLTKAITQLLYELDEETNLFVSSEIDEIDSCFTKEGVLNFYRFVQESISNVIKHSEATTLQVVILKKEREITATIQDNGKGFQNSEALRKNSLGIKTMHERIKILGGKLTLENTNGKGSLLNANIPLKNGR
ncbi:MAG: histidine kinase [Flavobacteriaceae bacterium]